MVKISGVIDLVEIEQLPPHFQSTIVACECSDLEPGSYTYIVVSVENDGDQAGSVILEVWNHNGELIRSVDGGTIEPGASKTIEIDTIPVPDEPGEYTYTLKTYNMDTESYDDEDQFTLTVSEGEGGGNGGEGDEGGDEGGGEESGGGAIGIDINELIRLMLIASLFSKKDMGDMMSRIINLMIMMKLLEQLQSTQ